MNKPLEQIRQELLECAQAWEGEARLLGNVRADEIIRLLSTFDIPGWTREVPTEEGHYLFIGGYEGHVENVVLTAPVYAKLSMAYTDETGKTPDGVVARINGFTGWPDQFSGLWHRIHYPDPPKD